MMKRADFMHLVEFPILSQVPMSICIGVFDGLHRGHQMIINTCVQAAKAHGWQSMVITFNRNPKYLTSEEDIHGKLLTDQQFEETLRKMEVDNLVVIDFSADFSKLSASEFLNLVRMICTVKMMVVGEDFRCGTPASCAGPGELQEYLHQRDPECKVVIPSPVRLDDGEVISSTLVRKKLTEGDLEQVQEMLGRPYGLDLTRYSLRIHDDCLWYRTGSFEQILPLAGTYQAKLEYSDGSASDVVVRLDGDTLMVPWKSTLSGTVRIKTLDLLKRSGT
jgi:riboflavin kinase/FMN adenylyltransferase